MSVIGRISAVLDSDGVSTGDRAALRRMQAGHPPPLVFYRFAMRYLPDGWEKKLDDWMAITAGMALMAPHSHNLNAGLGKVLAEEGYSEARLERLLASEEEVRRLLLLRVARFLASKGKTMNWVEGAALLLTGHGKQREALHRRIAKEFYSVLNQIEQRQGVS
ncbi:MAG TPA: type I-E CRISPR-associated protein Cse2/CasB [Firmicutes bacterium]|nr:type I-E CRISPR-associated protein Cse2/CasB [Bacillota bacterium]